MTEEHDKDVHIHIHEIVTPLRDRLIKVETRVEHMEGAMKELTTDLKEVKQILLQHKDDEQGMWNFLRESLNKNALATATNAEKISSLKWWAVSVGTGAVVVIEMIDRFGFLSGS